MSLKAKARLRNDDGSIIKDWERHQNNEAVPLSDTHERHA